MTPSNGITFPASSSTDAVQSNTHLRPPHLPFRRISLPTAPTLMHRESVVSVASFGSLVEEDDGAGHAGHSVPVPVPITPNKGKSKDIPELSTSISPPRRGRVLSGDSSLPSSPLSQRFGSPNYQVSPKRRERLRSGAKTLQDEARESKRRKVIQEFLDTERAYVAGLDLIYEHFLLPLLSSLDTPNPILGRAELTSIFSNFIDIWNFHHTFLDELESTIGSALSNPPSPSPNQSQPNLPPLSPVLLSHFPYLSLYTLFITSFASTIDTLISLTTPPSQSHFPSFSQSPTTSYNPTFAAFLSAQESHPRCQKLHLRDWLLTIVQRCPRYLLLLKDLRSCTDQKSEEYEGLGKALGVVSRITTSLNTSLQTHNTTLTLLTLQRTTTGLPFPLVAPTRTFLKRGRLTIQESESGARGRAREREVLLFNDALVWLGKEGEWEWWEGLQRPQLLRGRSKSEAELTTLASLSPGGKNSRPSTPKKGGGGYRRSYHPPSSPHSVTFGEEERWVCKGHVGIVDLEVVLVGVREEGEGEDGGEWDGEEPRVELLSPEGSWVLYGEKEELISWTRALRAAKATLLSSLGTTGHTTLNSSAATKHVRRSLMALPFKPGDARVAATIRARPNTHTNSTSPGSKSKGSTLTAVPEISKAKGKDAVQRRSKVEHFVPAVWVPDEKTPSCMRCGRGFGWRRRRHHCRLCGRCVCAGCSGRTFYITDTRKGKENSAVKPARACDACYDAVFPVVQPASPTISLKRPQRGEEGDETIRAIAVDRWFSSPSQSPQTGGRGAKELMTFDFEVAQKRGGGVDERKKSVTVDAGEVDDEDGDEEEGASASPTPTPTPTPKRRVEDTVRRKKRFARPAVSVQSTSVTARTTGADHGVGEGEGDEGASRAGCGGSGGGGKKRFSLVLGRGGKGEREEGVREGRERESVVVGRLHELLGRK